MITLWQNCCVIQPVGGALLITMYFILWIMSLTLLVSVFLQDFWNINLIDSPQGSNSRTASLCMSTLQ